MRTSRSQRGFTLLEMLLVMTMMAILIGIAIPTFNAVVNKAKDTNARNILAQGARIAKAEYTSSDQAFAASLATQINASAQGFTVVPGTGFVLGQLAVERNSPQIVTLRTLSTTGELYAWKTIAAGAGAGDYRTHGTVISDYTNLVTNPSFETDASSWTQVTSDWNSTDLGRMTNWSYSGTYSYHVTGTKDASTNQRFIGIVSPGGTSGMPVTSGFDYTAQARMKVDDAGDSGQYLVFNWYSVGGGFIAQSYSSAATGTGPLSPTLRATAPSGAAYAGLYVLGYSSTASDVVDFSVDGIQVVQSSSILPYLDGDYPGVGWNGLPHASTSTGYAWERW